VSSPGDNEEMKCEFGSLGEIYKDKARLLYVYGNLKRYCINFSIAILPEMLDLM
jgi:hypothetical protein